MVTDSTADQVVDRCQGGANWRETQWMRSEAPMRLAVCAIVLLCCFGFLVDDRVRMIYPILGAGRMVTVGSKRADELAAVLASHLESR